MIGRLVGLVVDESDDGAVVVDVGGVGYEVFVPTRTAAALSPGEPITLHVHTHVREDALALFGFATALDRVAFRALLTVASIGPKLALAVLGKLDGPALAHAIARSDKGAFQGITGVGKKTVERILLDLRDKLPVGAAPLTTVTARPPAPTGALATVAAALTSMGYKAAEAERAIRTLEPAAEGKAPEVLLREALGLLG